MKEQISNRSLVFLLYYWTEVNSPLHFCFGIEVGCGGVGVGGCVVGGKKIQATPWVYRGLIDRNNGIRKEDVNSFLKEHLKERK